MHPLRFGLLQTGTTTRHDLRKSIRRAEGCGMTGVYVTDHLEGQLGAFSRLGAISMLSSSLRFGPLMLSNEIRHPVVAAQELVTLDVLSDGRLDVGLGAGWNLAEFAAAGIAFPGWERRVRRLGESLRIMIDCWQGKPPDRHGPEYGVAGLAGTPRPVQRPHPPILLPLGSGASLELSAKFADVVEIASNGASEAAIRARLADWQEARSAGGGRPHSRAFMLTACWTSASDPRVTTMAADRGTTGEELLRRPSFLAGPPEAMADALRRLHEDLGVALIIVPDTDLDVMEQAVAQLA